MNNFFRHCFFARIGTVYLHYLVCEEKQTVIFADMPIAH